MYHKLLLRLGLLISPEYVLHFQKSLAQDRHSPAGAYQQILNGMSMSLLGKPAQPQTHDELTGDTRQQ